MLLQRAQLSQFQRPEMFHRVVQLQLSFSALMEWKREAKHGDLVDSRLRTNSIYYKLHDMYLAGWCAEKLKGHRCLPCGRISVNSNCWLLFCSSSLISKICREAWLLYLSLLQRCKCRVSQPVSSSGRLWFQLKLPFKTATNPLGQPDHSLTHMSSFTNALCFVCLKWSPVLSLPLRSLWSVPDCYRPPQLRFPFWNVVRLLPIPYCYDLLHYF